MTILGLINSIDDDVILVGFSLGGHLVMETLNKVNNVKGIVLSSSPPISKSEDIAEAFIISELLELFTTESPDYTKIKKMFNRIIIEPSARAEIKEDFIATDPKVRRAIGECFSDPSMLKNEIKLLEDFKGEKLFIQGANDPLLNQDYLLSLAEKNIFKLKMLNNCGHYPPMESSESYLKHLKAISKICFG